MSKKVYCGKCRWHECGGGFGDEDSGPEKCNKITGYSSGYSAKKITVRTDGEPQELNADNDCAYYSWNWWGFREY